jgi:hypothetical protein
LTEKTVKVVYYLGACPICHTTFENSGINGFNISVDNNMGIILLDKIKAIMHSPIQNDVKNY